jgi:two-component system, NtrC family, response regulator HydG
MDSDDAFSDATTLARPALRAMVGDPAFVLRVIEGPSTGDLFVLDEKLPPRVLLGKSPACELRLADPAVSRRHAALEIVRGRLEFTDLGSTNGTLVNGVSIRSAFLGGGETVRLGGSALSIEAAGRQPVPATEPVRSFGRVHGAAPCMQRLYALFRRLAASNLPLLIEGETGTGKEQLAEALHEQGPRAAGPFVVLDCTAVAPSLIESELFGHQRGAFTGSLATHRGVFERADGGTLLVDEIGDLPLPLQPKLLRVIERAEVMRVGAERPVRFDVRLLFATRRDLDHEVQCGRFRDDLFHRIAVTRVELPPLRSRPGDVELLARLFWSDLGGRPEALREDLLRRWADYPWPGNVRELRNAVLRWLAVGDIGDDAALPPDSSGTRAHPAVSPPDDAIARILAQDLPLVDARARVIEELERRYLEHMLEVNGGNVTRAAAAAGIARRHFHRLKARYLLR